MEPSTHAVLARLAATSAGLPKHARLRAAIADAVQAGELRSGTKMSGERELSEALGVSLGTMQKALGRLVDDGYLVRRHGHGTFVGEVPRRPVSGSWHFRFLSEDGCRELPGYTTLLDRRIVAESGPWSEVLGEDSAGYVVLLRRIEIDGRFECASRLYLGATRFGKLLRVAARKLGDINLKAVLESEFAAPTLHSDGVAHVVEPTDEDVRLLGVARRAGLQLQIVGYSFGRAPITFQRVFVPPTPHGLRLTFTAPEAPAAALAAPAGPTARRPRRRAA